MLSIYNQQAPKLATNLSINSDLLTKAQALNINLSTIFEQTLVEIIKANQQNTWRKDNQEAIALYNNLVEAHGTFSDELRSF